MDWKYVRPITEKEVKVIEKSTRLLFPDDFKKLLPVINAGKPSSVLFDLENENNSVFDYMIDSENLKDYQKRYKKYSLFPIATDSFGNLICYKVEGKKLTDIMFWDHENNSISLISNSFSAFIDMLY